VNGVRLMRAAVDGRPRVLLDVDGSTTVVTVDGTEFEDLPPLLEACGGDVGRISPGRGIELDDAGLLRPLGAPAKIVCIGLNYREHAEESGAPLPRYPLLFSKYTSALTDPESDIPLPPESALVDWESELAFVFGRRCRRVSAGDAHTVVFGYTAANDVSMRDFQNHTTQFLAGKTWERSTPLGPAVIPADELGGASPDLAISGSLNGSTVQDSRTSDLIFSIPQLVEYMTTIMTMEPGDVVLTGTPSGVGFAESPPRGLSVGDVYEVEIEGIGRLRNRFTGEAQLAR
jgi:acylpyruvate hydrolase